MNQLSLVPEFDGDCVDVEDFPRLITQLDTIRAYMSDGKWRTLRQIAAATKAPESSVSAQLRNLRKPRFGGCTVNRRSVGNGLYVYQVMRGV